MMKYLIGTCTAIALSAAPAMAAPVGVSPAPVTNSASALSLGHNARVGSVSRDGNALAGQGSIIAAVLAAGIVVGGIILIADSDDDSDSN